MSIRAWSFAAFAMLAASCNPAPQAESQSVVPVDGRVNLAAELAGQWDEVCILPPYTTNGRAREVLGVSVDLRDSSRIWNSDGIALLVTMDDDGVAGMYEVPLRPVDFTPLAGCCFPRGNAAFGVSADGDAFAVSDAENAASAAVCPTVDLRIEGW